MQFYSSSFPTAHAHLVRYAQTYPAQREVQVQDMVYDLGSRHPLRVALQIKE